MNDMKAPAHLIWALGVTQIIGYGTLYYSFSILAPAMARDLSIPEDRLFGLLSVALLMGGLLAPKAGKWADRFGASRLMVPGSLAAAVSLVCAALSTNALVFGASMIAMELASTFVLYSTAFAAIVQVGGSKAQRSIVHLTLIAGFASTLFWPLTATLHDHLGWREIYLVFALLNGAVCMPIHWWVGRFPRELADSRSAANSSGDPAVPPGNPPPRNAIFLLMLAGFALEGFVLASVLVHMVPLLTALGLGTAGLMVSTLFGPSQVASRLLNMIFGGRLSQTVLAVISAGLLAAALAVLLATTPWLPGLVAFAILFGLGSGLASIVGGTLPLELFGKRGYGARLGWVTAARQFSSALAPFAFAVMLKAWGASMAVTVSIAGGLAAVVLFGAIALSRTRTQQRSAAESLSSSNA
ncbi:arsenite efflux MFS transporter ArsK [Rhizobium sp. LC145]|uniref:arsenite efflux MFS transporter ArsK n=1 Tax=Rhizobium sp. LC145 TaxID=1120688 RepID=UPI00062A1E17|nr:arsenite efflux MFS transporter ArsK [Rhizobium sp. LC145]KKX29363.1 major facilitator transporter [Rhizobium sp. LC145]MDX3927891.1 arsenite efflux MFS transporter ArsK [Shinella sp.]TKT68975.1 arsenite efflux MFS transporter ArsK [Rhizobiaceae bacterium LC148]